MYHSSDPIKDKIQKSSQKTLHNMCADVVDHQSIKLCPVKAPFDHKFNEKEQQRVSDLIKNERISASFPSPI